MKPSFLLRKVRESKWKENEAHFGKKRLVFDVDEKKNLNYMGDGNPFHDLDIYGPTGSAGALPVIVQIHGGGYISLDKFINEAQGKYFAQQGFRVVNINYSLQPEADFTGVMREIFCAMRWIERNAAEYGMDAERLFVYGDSAGGHYAMLAGIIQKNPAMQEYYKITPLRSGICGIAVSCPMYEIQGIREKNDFASLFLRRILLPGSRKKDDTYVNNVSIPALLEREEFPEIFLLTTPTDEVLYREVRSLHELLQQKGIAHRYREYTSAERTLGHVFHATDPEFPESEQANHDILDYFLELTSREREKQ